MRSEHSPQSLDFVADQLVFQHQQNMGRDGTLNLPPIQSTATRAA
jgi:hypothetical protein